MEERRIPGRLLSGNSEVHSITGLYLERRLTIRPSFSAKYLLSIYTKTPSATR
jgi:hypothetical protein